MPELSEVENYRKYLEGTSLHQKIVTFSCLDNRLLKMSDQTFREHLLHKSFINTERIGKYLFINTDGDRTLVMHFGMTGRLKYYKDKEDRPKFGHIVFEFDNGFNLAFENKRKFGWLDLTKSLSSYKKEKNLSDDAGDLTCDDFYASLKNRKSSIKPVLLNQSVAAGIGNWMADEILYQARIHPDSKVGHLNEEQLRAIFKSMKHVVDVSLKKEAVYTEFPEDFLIHNRNEDGKCYHTGEDIKKIKVGGRSTFISPSWQKKI